MAAVAQIGHRAHASLNDIGTCVRRLKMKLQLLGPNCKDKSLADLARWAIGRRPELAQAAGIDDCGVPIQPLHPAMKEIHVADEIRNKARCGPFVQLGWRPHLQHPPLRHDGDAVRQRKRLFLIMGDENEGDADRLLQRSQLQLHLLPQFLVESAQWLVEQQHLGPLDQRPGKGHALAFAARKLGRAAPGVAGQLDQAQRLLHLGVDFRLREARLSQAEGDVSPHVEVRKDGVVLKHHVHGTPMGGNGQHGLAIDVDFAAVGRLQAGQHAQQGRFSATRGAEQGKKFAAPNFEARVIDGAHRAETLANGSDRDDFIFWKRVGHAIIPDRAPCNI